MAKPPGERLSTVLSAFLNQTLYSFSATLVGKSRWINPWRELSITIVFRPSYEGRYEETLELTFHDVRRNERFSIARRIRATVGSIDDQNYLKPKAPYIRRRSVPLPLDGPIIAPLRPPTWTETKWVVFLPEYEAPSSLINAAYGFDGRKVVARNFMPSVFNEKTYGRHFQYMLWIEEEQRRLTPQLYVSISDVLADTACFFL